MLDRVCRMARFFLLVAVPCLCQSTLGDEFPRLNITFEKPNHPVVVESDANLHVVVRNEGGEVHNLQLVWQFSDHIHDFVDAQGRGLGGVFTYKRQQIKAGEAKTYSLTVRPKKAGALVTRFVASVDDYRSVFENTVHCISGERDKMVHPNLSMDLNLPKNHKLKENVTYRLRLGNRGNTDFDKLQVVAKFSDGIDPVEIKVHDGEIVSGKVVFENIKLDYRQTMTIDIIARASKTGTHVVRVVARGPNVHVITEQTSYFVE